MTVFLVPIAETQNSLGKKLQDSLNVFFAGIAAIFGIFAFIYVLRDHQPKPHLDLVFANRSNAIMIHGGDMG